MSIDTPRHGARVPASISPPSRRRYSASPTPLSLSGAPQDLSTPPCLARSLTCCAAATQRLGRLQL
eukprot:scaffold16637_cov48-Phaeocystis_antarctica.AAC.1